MLAMVPAGRNRQAANARPKQNEVLTEEIQMLTTDTERMSDAQVTQDSKDSRLPSASELLRTTCGTKLPVELLYAT